MTKLIVAFRSFANTSKNNYQTIKRKECDSVLNCLVEDYLVKKICAFYETKNLIGLFTRSCYCIISCARLIILITSCYVRLIISEDLFPLLLHFRHLSHFHQIFQAHTRITLEGRYPATFYHPIRLFGYLKLFHFYLKLTQIRRC
jgi:hypothetical protein